MPDRPESKPIRSPIKGPIKAPTRMPNAIAQVMSWGYGLGIGMQNWRFDRGIGVTRLDVPVISIGNLSTGGTGKTPMVHWVANELLALGKHPAIAMRGYKAPPGEMGDEEREHRQALPGVPVVAQPNRIAGLERLFETDPVVDCVILDDGFQHRQLARDADIVLIDASSPPYADGLLPRGYLRDPISSLARADAVVVTHREMVTDGALDELIGWIESQVPGCPIAITSHVWSSAMVYTSADDGWEAQEWKIDALKGQAMLGVCGIGNPGGFLAQIERVGWELVDSVVLGDHDPFDSMVVETVCQRLRSTKASTICMTRKDWVKAQDRLGGRSLQVVVPGLSLGFETGVDGVRSLIQRLAQ